MLSWWAEGRLCWKRNVAVPDVEHATAVPTSVKDAAQSARYDFFAELISCSCLVLLPIVKLAVFWVLR